MAMKIRSIERFINRRFPNGPYVLVKREPDTLLFSNRSDRLLGLIHRGDHVALHDIGNPNDTPEKPTLKLRITTKKIQVLHDEQ